MQRPSTSFDRNHRSIEPAFEPRSSSVLGHASQPAASFGFGNRKINLDPKHKDTILKLPPEKPYWGKLNSSKRSEGRDGKSQGDKRKAVTPQGGIRIRADTMLFKAEKQIINNPLLQGPSQQAPDSLGTNSTFSIGKSQHQQVKPTIVKDISSISLPELCVLHNAFLNADEDGNGTLDPNEFVTAFMPFFSNPGDVGRLFMRIDADCDGIVSWEEILSFVLSQDDAKMSINAEYMRREFLYPSTSENSQGEILIWKIDEVEEASKFHRPKSFHTDLTHVAGVVHLQHSYNSDRLALFTADKQVSFLEVMRESCKQSGAVKLDFSPQCFNVVNQLSDAGEVVEQALAFGDDRGSVHLFRAHDLYHCAEFNLRLPNERSAAEARVRTWSPHDRSAFVYKVEYCADIKLLISCGSDGQVVLSDVDQGCKKGDSLRHRSDVHDFVWLRRYQQLVSCGIERHLKIWQIGLKSPVDRLQGHQTSVQRLLWEGGQLLSMDLSKVLIVWDLSAMTCVQKLDLGRVHPDSVIGGIAYDPRRGALATLARGICLWPAADRKAPNGHVHPVTCGLYNPIFEMVITSDESAEVRVWDLNTGTVIFCFSRTHVNSNGEPVKISAMAFDLTFRRLITGAHDGTARVWNFSTGQCLAVLDGFGTGEISALASITIKPFDYIVGCGWSRKVTFWLDEHSQQARKGFAHSGDPDNQFSTFKPSFSFSGHKDDILSMVCHRASSLLVTGSFDGDIIIWKVESATVRTRLILPGILSMQGDQKPIEQIETIDCGPLTGHPEEESEAPSLMLIATVGGDEYVRIWSTDDSAELLLEIKRTLDGEDHFADVSDLGLVGLAVCSRNKVMVIADTKNYVLVYDITKTIESSRKFNFSRTHEVEPPVKCCKFRTQAGHIKALRYIGTRRLILTCSQDCNISLWTILGEKMGNFGELSEWKFTKEIHHYEHLMDHAVFSNDSNDNASSSALSPADSLKTFARGEKLKGASMSRKKTSAEIQTLKRRQSLKNKLMTLRVLDDSKHPKETSPEGDHTESFFLTGTNTFQNHHLSADSLPSETASMADAVEEEVHDSLKEGHSSEAELGTDSDISEADPVEIDDVNYQLKESIDNILSRALSMRERGERYFEPGQPVVPAYQKIKVSEISNVELPESVVKRILQHKPGKKLSAFVPAKKRTDF